MWRRNRVATIPAAAAALATAAALTSGCGATGGTITVGAALPAAGVPAAVPVAHDAPAVGPGAVTATLARRGYEIGVHVTPNRATAPNRIVLTLRQDGAPVAGAHVALAVNMLTMDMGTARYVLAGSDDYAVRAPAWVMAGTWQLTFAVTPPGAATLRFALDDRLR
jgi:hypothetical protein